MEREKENEGDNGMRVKYGLKRVQIKEKKRK